MYLAVLLTVHNRKEKTFNCLKSLFNQQFSNNIQMFVFLTDDGCTDGTADMITIEFPQVHIVKGDGSLFWNLGMRKAWEAAYSFLDFDYYLWLNDDTFLFPSSLSTLISSCFKFNNKSIIVGSTVTSIDYQKISYGGWSSSGKLIFPCDHEIPCAYFNGNIVLIPKFVFDNLGFNDSYFKHALGDFDYGLRSKKYNINSYLAPGIIGVCDLHEELAIWCNPKYSFMRRLKSFRSPLGQNPEEFFLFDLRHKGIFTAIFHYFTIHFRLFFPKIWI